MEYFLREISAVAVLFSTIAILSGCHIGYPFQGPGYDPENGARMTDKETQVFVAITHGVVNKNQKTAFSDNLKTVLASLSNSPGLIGYSVRKQLFGNEVWTMSAWTTEEALYNFITSAAHRNAAEHGGISPETVRSAYLWTSAKKLPLSWKEAQHHLKSQASQSCNECTGK